MFARSALRQCESAGSSSLEAEAKQQREQDGDGGRVVVYPVSQWDASASVLHKLLCGVAVATCSVLLFVLFLTGSCKFLRAFFLCVRIRVARIEWNWRRIAYDAWRVLEGLRVEL